MTQTNIKAKLLLFLTMLLSSQVFLTSCDVTETVDNTSFAIYYTSMTDIGPSMTGVINAPSYIGEEPSGFKITAITCGIEPYTGKSFSIDEKTGSILIAETASMPTGLYKLSISCLSAGSTHEFKDIVQVNMMKPVPEGITVEPSLLTADYADVVDPTSEVELPTAQVLTDGNHVSIKKYELIETDYSKFFAISSMGEISIVRANEELQPGKYSLSLKLTTGAVGEEGEEGIFEQAIEINITSRPLALAYTPNAGKIEEESAQSGSTTFVSATPVLKGSLEGLSYSMKTTPATDKITIDEQTGVLSVKENHGLKAGDIYTIDVIVKNQYAEEEGVKFSSVFELEVVTYIAPIKNFAYADVSAIQSVEFEISLDENFVGDEVKFEFVELPAELQNNLSIDYRGKITAPKGHTIPLGEYPVKVKASNPKSDEQNPTIASFVLTIGKNPNFFTYVRYGNNLGLSPEENYANQFRISHGGSLADVKPTPNTDATEELFYEMRGIYQSSGSTIDSKTGEITLAGLSEKQCAVVMVTATAGKGTAAEYIVQTPVFFHFSDKTSAPSNSADQVTIEYSPFVFQVNPSQGGRSVQPKIEGVGDMSKFTLDYRRTFNYYNFFGTHQDGQPKTSGSFLQNLWDSYAESTASNPNYGSRKPVSYYENIKNGESLTNALAYVDPATYELVVNPNKWSYEGEPANGVFIGQTTFETNGEDPQKGAKVFPIVLWFDTKF